MTTMKTKTKLFAQPTVETETLHRKYHTHVHSEEEASFIYGNGIHALHFEKGQLYVDDLPIFNPYHGCDSLSWKQQSKDHFSSGHLFFARGGTELHGVIYKGSHATTAVPHHVLATSIPTVNYNTQITKQRLTKETDTDTIPSNDWQVGLQLAISYEQEVGDPLPTPKVFLNDQDISEFTSWNVDPKTQDTVLILNLDASLVCDFDDTLYLRGSVAFNPYTPTPGFTGTLSSTCQDKQGTGVYFWKGEPSSQAMLQAPPHKPIQLSESELLQDDTLSIAELMTIVPDSSVSDQANDMLTENMKWAIAQDSTEKKWLSDFMGETAPVLSQARQDLIKRDMDFYQQKFSKSYFSWAFTNYDGQGKPTTNLDDKQKKKLKYFMQTGLAKEHGFNTQQNGIYIDAFVQAKPRLQAYINDKSTDWAQKLFDVITSPAQFTLMVNRVFGAAGQKGAMEPANNFSTLLTALQRSGELAQTYYKSVLAGSLTNVIHQSTAGGKDEIMKWLPDFLQAFLNKVATGGSVPDSAKITAEQIKEMQQLMGGNLTNVAAELADLMSHANGANILQKTKNMETAFAKKYPKLGAVGRSMFFACWTAGVIMVIQSFQNWKNLSDEKRTEAIISAVDLGFQGIEVVPEFLMGIKKMGLKGWQKFTNWRNSRNAVAKVENINDGLDKNWAENGSKATGELFDSEGKVIKSGESLWSRFLKGATLLNKIIAVVGVIAAAAFAVLSTIDFINDLNSGQPVTKIVFDGLIAATNVASAVCLVVDLFVTTTVFAMAAAILAIVGLVLAIVAMFVVKPKNPLTEFMENTAIPFVNGLPEQIPPPSNLAPLKS
ncbi:MAG: hypothetical protein AAF518_13750 [Spirochaetota bacterium]